MNTKKKLLESNATDKEITDLLTNPMWLSHPFVRKWEENYSKRLKESAQELGGLRGQTVGDSVGAGAGMQVAPTLEIFNAVIRGFSRYMDDSFVKKYQTDSVVFKVPLTEYEENVQNINAGMLEHTEKKIDYAVVDLSNPESEKGGRVTWTRAFLEDVTFDAQAEMMEGLGHAIAKTIMTSIIGGIDSVNPTSMPLGKLGDTTDIMADIVTVDDAQKAWNTFVDIVMSVDIGIEQADGTFKHYGPADYVLVAPDLYAQLLKIIQLTNVLYEGSTDPVNKGVIKLALGCTISKQSLLPSGKMVALNSEKAIALVTRRTLKIEPIVFPKWNEYGFLGSVRYGVTPLFAGAIQVATLGGT